MYKANRKTQASNRKSTLAYVVYVITLRTSLKPPLPSRESIRYRLFNTMWLVNL